ncbi:MAG: nucleoside hydrolase [Anaerolineae bacterium]|nr:nucleoside hydrolase [Anaerolineae bacterium]
MTTKIILDTDIGSDIDDAVCLAYLLAQPECELLGITTVSGESTKRAMLASVLCQAAGRDIPIFPGVEQPLLVEQRQPVAQQAKALTKWQHTVDYETGEALNFLRRTIRQHPGEIVLLTIGPLTNIGLLFASDPEIPTLLKGMVMMGGRFVNPIPDLPLTEWNIMLDPHAAAIVFKSPVPIRAVGLDVTLQVAMDPVAVRRQFNTPLLRPVLDFAEIWFEERDRIIFHDPLAGLTIFEPDLCRFESGRIDVELVSERLLGLTYWQPGGEGRHQIATTVDSARFFERFFSVFQR